MNYMLNIIRHNNKFSSVDNRSREMIPCHYDEVGFFSEGLCEVINRKAHIGFVDKEGKKVIGCKFDWASLNGFQEGLCLVAIRKDNEIWLGFIDKTGKTVIDCSRYDYAREFKNGYAPVQKSGLWGLIDKTGKEVKPCEYGDENKLFDEIV